MIRTIILALVITVLAHTSFASENVLRTKNALQICTRSNANWVSFCNGLMQGYADYVMLAGLACLPQGVTRTELVELFTADQILETTAYKNNDAALAAASEIFAAAYPC